MTNSAIRLDNPDWIPREIAACLREHRDDLLAAEYFDHIKNLSWCVEVVADLQEACRPSGIVAHHCTREAEPGEIASRGLRILAGGGDAHRAEFLARHADKFTTEELRYIKQNFSEVWSDPSLVRP
jgi:hypothetical protein